MDISEEYARLSLAGQQEIAKRIGQLRECHAVQSRAGNWDYSAYMRGMYNGLELALSIMNGREPSYKDTPEGGYIADKDSAVQHASPGCACGINDAGQRYVDPICRR